MADTHGLYPPQPTECAHFYHGYLRQVPSGNLATILEAQRGRLQEWENRVSPEQSLVVHSPYSWTLRQVMGHLADGERIFGYRLARVVTGDKTDLPGYDEQWFANEGRHNDVALNELREEWDMLRGANLHLIARTPAIAWDFAAQISGGRMTARAIAYILAGHIEHHFQIMRQRIGL